MTVPGYKKKRHPIYWVVFWLILGFPLLIALLALFGPEPSEREGVESRPPIGTVFAQDYPEDWPWPDYEQGRVSCSVRLFGGQVRRPVVLIELGGTQYALNGAALNLPEYPDSRELMGRTELGAYQGNSQTFIQIGLDICQ